MNINPKPAQPEQKISLAKIAKKNKGGLTVSF